MNESRYDDVEEYLRVEREMLMDVKFQDRKEV